MYEPGQVSKKVPLLIALSGHISLDDEQDARDRFADFLDGLSEKYRHTEFVIISGMAPGSDLMGAEVAVEKGHRLLPLFPCDLKTYIEANPDICGEDYQSRVSSLLEHANTLSPIFLFDKVEDINDAYRIQSGFLIANSHIIVAFWNGSQDSNSGGTFQTIKMAYSGMSPELKQIILDYGGEGKLGAQSINNLDIGEDSLIYWIRADRKGQPNEAIPDEVRGGYLMPRILDKDFVSGKTMLDRLQPALPHFYDSLFSKIDSLNQVLEGCRPFSDPRKELEDSSLLSVENAPERIRALRDRMVDEGRGASIAYHYSIVDRMSVDKRAVNLKVTNILSWIAVLTTLFYSIFMLAAGSVVFNIIYLVFLVLSLSLTAYYYRMRTFHKYLNYRCIAECLRVEFYRNISGTGRLIHPTSYEDVRNDTMWISFCVRAWLLEGMIRKRGQQENDKDVLDVVEYCWVNSQLEYHRWKYGVNSKGYRKHRILGKFLSSFNVMITAIVLIFMTFLLNDTTVFLHIDGLVIDGVVWIKELNVGYVQIARIILMIVVALRAREGFDFSSMNGGTPDEIMAKVNVYRIADIRYRNTEDIDEKKKTLYELGEYGYLEQYSWLFEHKKKDYKR